MNVSSVMVGAGSDRCRIVSPKAIAPLRLLRVAGGEDGQWGTRWYVVYPDGEVNALAWERMEDAIRQASVAVPYHSGGCDG